LIFIRQNSEKIGISLIEKNLPLWLRKIRREQEYVQEEHTVSFQINQLFLFLFYYNVKAILFIHRQWIIADANSIQKQQC